MVMKGSPTSYGTVSDTLNRDYRISPDEDAANARLIAAAPELLEQCKKALAAWEGTGPAIPLDDVRAAIMKAEGRS
jgi:hypothetical protein